MNATNVLRRRPEPGEFAPYAQPDIDLVVGDDILHALAVQMQETQALLAHIDDRRATEFTYAPGKWNLKQIVGHLSDDERIFAYRALCIARKDTLALPGFDEKTYVEFANFENCLFRDLLEELNLVRQSTIALVRGFSAEAWMRSGMVNGYRATVRGLIYHVAGHELHHRKILREKYLG